MWSILLLLLVAILVICFCYWKIKSMQRTLENSVLKLDTSENKLFDHWYQQMLINHKTNFDIRPESVAALFLEKVYNININPKMLVIGRDLHGQYKQIVKNSKNAKNAKITECEYGRMPSAHELENDCIFSIRDVLGKDGEIMIVHDERVKTQLQMVSDYDLEYLNNIHGILSTDDIYRRGQDHLKKVLDFRWEKILELGDSRVLNSSGSYMYLSDIIIHDLYTAEHTVDDSTTYRVNLLCTDEEFGLLMRRWIRSLAGTN